VRAGSGDGMSAALAFDTAGADLPLGDLEGRIVPVDVPVARVDLEAMDQVIAAVHDLVMSPHYREHVLAAAPALARAPMQPDFGLFSGYDFHLTPDGPRLIEINTNAGGAFYGALMDDLRHRQGITGAHPLGHWSDLFIRQVRNEWSLAGKGELSTVAIVDDQPDVQFLRLEFQLAARELRAAGINAFVTDPRELSVRDGRLHRGATRIDLVYNRLTSFSFDRPEDLALRQALEAGNTWITPGPRAHALLASKGNLSLMGDEPFLIAAGLGADARKALLRTVPKTVLMTAGNRAELWERRCDLYFKPLGGYGSRGVYAGAKLTRKTWEAMATEGAYVAQQEVPPSRVAVPGYPDMRCDVRTYAYQGRAFMRLARLYRGQTTNFRTPGGGFASVVET